MGYLKGGRLALASCAVGCATYGVVALGLHFSSTSANGEAHDTHAAAANPVSLASGAITLAFAGDTNFEGANASKLAADPSSVLSSVRQILSGADVAVVNMETAIATTGTAVNKDFAFKAPPAALDAYRAAGIDVVSAANNHGMDYGLEGLQQTLAAERRKKFPIIGIGQNEAEAFAPYRITIRGKRIAIIAATQVIDNDYEFAWTATSNKPGLASAKRIDRLVSEVQSAEEVSDVVVVFLHWGREGRDCPIGDQQSLAASLSEAGADIVVGAHAHRLQGAGMLGRTVVNYGLGNFVFGAGSAQGAKSGVFTVTFSTGKSTRYEWLPAQIVNAQPRPVTGQQKQAAVAEWNNLRGCTGLIE